MIKTICVCIFSLYNCRSGAAIPYRFLLEREQWNSEDGVPRRKGKGRLGTVSIAAAYTKKS